MSKIVCFLKFGEKVHLDGISKGELFFSNALKFRQIEEKLFIKGQGDKLEGGSMFYSQNMTMIDNDTNEVVMTGVSGNMLVHYEPANLLPVYCLFACYEKDCTRLEDGSLQFHIADGIKENIIEHFPKADSVAIISAPEDFVNSVVSSIGSDVKHGEVNYFNLYGFDSEYGKSMDIRYIKYLAQDMEPQKVPGGTQYTFSANYVYRSLLCKDEFFSKEQEYRFILPDRKINEGTIFNIDFKGMVDVQSLDNFWNNTK